MIAQIRDIATADCAFTKKRRPVYTFPA